MCRVHLLVMSIFLKEIFKLSKEIKINLYKQTNKITSRKFMELHFNLELLKKTIFLIFKIINKSKISVSLLLLRIKIKRILNVYLIYPNYNEKMFLNFFIFIIQ